MMRMTRHATERARQRGLSEAVLDIILECGTLEHAPGGALRVFLGKRATHDVVSRLKRAIQLVEKASGGCLVVKDDVVLTAYRKG